MAYLDRQIACIDCSQPFTFTAGEQEFYDRKGFKEEPKRCKPCRDARKSRRNAQLTDGASPGSGGGYGGHAGRNDDDNFGNRAPAPSARGPRDVRELRGTPRGSAARGPRSSTTGGGEREMFDAVCAQCGAQTRVPFRPVAGRPVYCRECYGGRRGVGGSL